ncbi:MAG: hypothetical protein IH984_07135 [Planctomycetes bacterium]|nr:hypothetical protein [Planctomycetota bacterium]
MKRRIIKLAVFILLGAIVNVAVAWASALWVDAMAPKYFPAQLRGNTAANHPRWGVLVTPEFSSTHVQSSASRKPPARSPLPPNATKDEIDAWLAGKAIRVPKDIIEVPYWSRTSKPPKESDYEAMGLWEEARGWPMRSLVWYYSHRFSDSIEIKRWSIELSGTQGPIGLPRALPLRPIPLGFVINSLIYALCIWILFAVKANLRRITRSKRGHCIKCGYDLRGSSGISGVCPECGVGDDDV